MEQLAFPFSKRGAGRSQESLPAPDEAVHLPLSQRKEGLSRSPSPLPNKSETEPFPASRQRQDGGGNHGPKRSEGARWSRPPSPHTRPPLTHTRPPLTIPVPLSPVPVSPLSPGRLSPMAGAGRLGAVPSGRPQGRAGTAPLPGPAAWGAQRGGRRHPPGPRKWKGRRSLWAGDVEEERGEEEGGEGKEGRRGRGGERRGKKTESEN